LVTCSFQDTKKWICNVLLEIDLDIILTPPHILIEVGFGCLEVRCFFVTMDKNWNLSSLCSILKVWCSKIGYSVMILSWSQTFQEVTQPFRHGAYVIGTLIPYFKHLINVDVFNYVGVSKRFGFLHQYLI